MSSTVYSLSGAYEYVATVEGKPQGDEMVVEFHMMGDCVNEQESLFAAAFIEAVGHGFVFHVPKALQFRFSNTTTTTGVTLEEMAAFEYGLGYGTSNSITAYGLQAPNWIRKVNYWHGYNYPTMENFYVGQN